MVEKQLIWTFHAENDIADILRFFRERNGNNNYGEKLLTAFQSAAELVRNNVKLGMCQSCHGRDVRFIVVEKTYQLFYEVKANRIMIIRIWDARRDPDSLELN
ncbi:MAG: type II toxin-antitoxin system RelE/ParE family toxin [Planctomycetaceae bacterium]|jgi:plasmid stabilization system protein ParE|nr:type II toxin-antitoxin system RelE/ParE family toxin [Planctomycetaceae bacterium]